MLDPVSRIPNPYTLYLIQTYLYEQTDIGRLTRINLYRRTYIDKRIWVEKAAETKEGIKKLRRGGKKGKKGQERNWELGHLGHLDHWVWRTRVPPDFFFALFFFISSFRRFALPNPNPLSPGCDSLNQKPKTNLKLGYFRYLFALQCILLIYQKLRVGTRRRGVFLF